MSDGGKKGFIGEIATGMTSIWWAVTHPWQGGLRTFGALSAMLGMIALVAGVAHLVAGRPGSARLTTNPTDIGAWSADNLVRPVINTGTTAVQQTVRPIVAEEESPVILNLNQEPDTTTTEQ